MSRKLKFVVVVLMLAIVPVRALATVTTGFCAMDLASSAGVEGDDPGGPHGDHPASQGNDPHDGCTACAEHCASSVLVSVPALPLPPVCGAPRISSVEPFAGGFIPEHLDPPPLAA